MTQRRVLVIGGTGFLGRRITEAFSAAGDQVAVLSRGKRPIGGAEVLAADRHDADALRSALGVREFDVVVDNIAFDAADVVETLDVLGNRVGHFLLTSSTAVYADRFTRRPLREADADLAVRAEVDGPNAFHPRLGHAYANGKRAAEQALVASAGALAWTVLRPPVIVAADDRTQRVWWFVQRLRDGGPILIPEWGPGRIFQLAWTEDVARAFVACAGQPSAYRRTFNVAQAEVFTAESFLVGCADALGVRPRWVRVAEDELAGYTLPIAGRPFGHMLVDISAIRFEVGFEPRPENEWLAVTIRGCAANPPAQDSAGYDRRAAELALAERRA